MLTFNLKKEWYEKIRRGEKTIEYREAKPYWNKRIHNAVMAEFGRVNKMEVHLPVVASYYKGQPAEWYDKDAHEKAHKKWNRRVNNELSI